MFCGVNNHTTHWFDVSPRRMWETANKNMYGIIYQQLKYPKKHFQIFEMAFAILSKIVLIRTKLTIFAYTILITKS